MANQAQIPWRRAGPFNRQQKQLVRAQQVVDQATRQTVRLETRALAVCHRQVTLNVLPLAAVVEDLRDPSGLELEV
jgi:hypothetical protein